MIRLARARGRVRNIPYHFVIGGAVRIWGNSDHFWVYGNFLSTKTLKTLVLSGLTITSWCLFLITISWLCCCSCSSCSSSCKLATWAAKKGPTNFILTSLRPGCDERCLINTDMSIRHEISDL